MQKVYLERGTQTSPIFSSSHFGAAESTLHEASDGYISCSSDLDSSQDSSKSLNSARLDAAYRHFSEADSGISDPMSSRLIQRVARVKAHKLGYNRPSRLCQSVKRAVSHPDAMVSHQDPPGVVHEDATMRVVSLPERLKPTSDGQPLSPFRYVPSRHLYVPGDDEIFRNYTHSPTTSEVPHTPSPPSSPASSILIVGGDVHLPRAFLRSVESKSEDKDQTALASSPPRPIPALHGPSSLPYARCPSGAEGSVIETPEDLLGMIWGLKSEEPPNRSLVISTDITPETPHTPTPLRKEGRVQPWLRDVMKHKTTQMSSQIQTNGVGMYNTNHLLYSQQDQTSWAALQQKFPQNSGSPQIPGNPAGASMLCGPRPTSALLNSKQYSEQTSGAFPGWDFVNDALLKTESFRRPGINLDSVALSGGLRFQSPQRLKPTASVFVPSHEHPQVSGIRIALDSLRAQQPQVMPPQHLPARRLREQQISNLPIPSSPSPSSWSQKLVSRQAPADRLDAAHSPMDFHPEQRWYNTVYDPYSILKDNARYHVTSPIYQTPQVLAPSVQINQVVAQTDSPPAHRQRVHAAADPLSKFIQRHSLFSPQFSPPASRPRPPPNTPFSPSLAPDSTRVFSATSPPSPASPTPLTRAVLRQSQPSVPFTRPIQRRLSAIREESSSSLKEISDIRIQPPAVSLKLPTLPTSSSSFTSPDRPTAIQCQKATPNAPTPNGPSPKIVTINVRLPPRSPRTAKNDGEAIIYLSNLGHGSSQFGEEAKTQEEINSRSTQLLEVAETKEVNLKGVDVDELEKAKTSSPKRKRARKPKRAPTSRFSLNE